MSCTIATSLLSKNLESLFFKGQDRIGLLTPLIWSLVLDRLNNSSSKLGTSELDYSDEHFG